MMRWCVGAEAELTALADAVIVAAAADCVVADEEACRHEGMMRVIRDADMVGAAGCLKERGGVVCGSRSRSLDEA